MSNSIKLHVEGARKYSFTDRDSGRLVEGVNVFYTKEASDENSVGRIPSKVTLPYDTWNEIAKLSPKFPCDCFADTQQELTAKGVKTNVVAIRLAEKQ